MRLPTVAVTVVMSMSGSALAAPAWVPSYDTAKTCQAQAAHDYAATLGEIDMLKDMDACTLRERDQKGSVEALWPLASDADRIECLNIAEGRYDYLARCLDGSRSVRAAR